MLRNLSSKAYQADQECLEAMVPYLHAYERHYPAILTQARRYVEAMRAASEHVGMESFLREYRLNSPEGMAMLHLAEALLRIPDKDTADALISGNVEGIQWRQPGRDIMHNSLMGNTRVGLNIVQKILHLGDGNTPFSRLFARASDPLVRSVFRRAIRLMGRMFIMGESIPVALRHAAKAQRKGYMLSYDMLGEGARTAAQAEHYTSQYRRAIRAIGEKNAENAPLYKRASISIKLSALHPRFELLKYNRMMEELLPRLKMLCLEAKQQNIMVTIDAEEAARLDISLALMNALLRDKELKGFNGIGLAVQAYQKRALPVLASLRDLAEETGRRIPIRLVKGAYWDTEIKRAHMLGLSGFPVFTRKEHTDVSYLACTVMLLEHPACFYPQFATHNALTIASIKQIANSSDYEFQRLQGMGGTLYDYVLAHDAVACRIYAPVGPQEELLAYLIRRLLENGASTSFVHQVADPSIAPETLLQDPIALTFKAGIHMDNTIRLPDNLYGEARQNSRGLDIGNRYQMYRLHSQLQPLKSSVWFASPLINGEAVEGEPVMAVQPSNHAVAVGEVVLAGEAEAKRAMEVAQAAFPAWNGLAVEHRAALLEKLSDALEDNAEEFYSLCMREAGKTLADSIAEVREAVDFCRYYAVQARILMGQEQELPGPTGESNRVSLHGRGVFVCISPWNFPLAIFTGQMLAALVTGNTVIAKPANQTPLIAYRLVTLMLEVGFPSGVVHFVPGEGRVVGSALVKDRRTAGVVFTGSTATARFINRTLAERDAAIVPFIAETGGQNCMILDSSALLEQAVDDIIMSAFNSAGQRCSALRVLYVQEEVADRLIALLAGAMQELKLGEPTHFSTDIGPVIDKAAKETLEAHIARMKEEAIFHYATPLESDLAEMGTYVAPHLFEIPSLALLDKEVFGPIVHVVRFKAANIHKVVDEINSTGYGLTLGIFSRIEQRVQYSAERVRVGNIYVNRSMVGATVGVQPFGGEGLSGTGPKAGGTFYLTRFCVERTISVNTAAIGGNVELLV